MPQIVNTFVRCDIYICMYACVYSQLLGECDTDGWLAGWHLIRSFSCRFVIGQYVTVHGDVISHVNISHVMVEDGGEYTCTAENRAGRTSHSARLNVYGIY